MPTTDKPPLHPIPDGWRQLEPGEPRRAGDAFLSFGQWVIFNRVEVDSLADEWPCIRRVDLDAEVKRLKAEVERFKRGDLTADELNEFCHNLPPDRKEPFCDGCDTEQRKLFGTCRTDELKAEVERLKKELDISRAMLDREAATNEEFVKINEQLSNRWIPCSSRMPTAEDGDVEGCVDWFAPCDVDDTKIVRGAWDAYSRGHAKKFQMQWRRTGITSLPEPPAEPETPQRRVYDDVESIVQLSCGNLLSRHLPPDERRLMVLQDGDPNIDACRELLRYLESQGFRKPSDWTHQPPNFKRAEMARLIENCWKGTTNAD